LTVIIIKVYVGRTKRTTERCAQGEISGRRTRERDKIPSSLFTCYRFH